MREINPYEAPQCDSHDEPLSITEEQLPDIPWPAWLGKALWAQFAAIVMTYFCGAITSMTKQQTAWNTIVLCLMGIAGLLSLLNLIAAFRYRIGWLVVLELIVICLPVVAVLTILFSEA
jgi:hypothetical protein